MLEFLHVLYLSAVGVHRGALRATKVFPKPQQHVWNSHSCQLPRVLEHFTQTHTQTTHTTSTVHVSIEQNYHICTTMYTQTNNCACAGIALQELTNNTGILCKKYIPQSQSNMLAYHTKRTHDSKIIMF